MSLLFRPDDPARSVKGRVDYRPLRRFGAEGPFAREFRSSLCAAAAYFTSPETCAMILYAAARRPPVLVISINPIAAVMIRRARANSPRPINA